MRRALLAVFSRSSPNKVGRIGGWPQVEAARADGAADAAMPATQGVGTVRTCALAACGRDRALRAGCRLDGLFPAVVPCRALPATGGAPVCWEGAYGAGGALFIAAVKVVPLSCCWHPESQRAVPDGGRQHQDGGAALVVGEVGVAHTYDIHLFSCWVRPQVRADIICIRWVRLHRGQRVASCYECSASRRRVVCERDVAQVDCRTAGLRTGSSVDYATASKVGCVAVADAGSIDCHRCPIHREGTAMPGRTPSDHRIDHV